MPFLGTLIEAGNQLEAMGLSQIIKVILGARLKLSRQKLWDLEILVMLNLWLCRCLMFQLRDKIE